MESLGENLSTILLREDHPLTRGAVTWERLAGFPVIRLYISDLEQVGVLHTSESFNRIRNPQQGSLETSHLLTALEVLRNTEYFLPGPAYLTRNEQATRDIIALPVPEGAQYDLEYRLVAHARTAHSPLHSWLWEQILDTLRDMRVRTVHRG